MARTSRVNANAFIPGMTSEIASQASQDEVECEPVGVMESIYQILVLTRFLDANRHPLSTAFVLGSRAADHALGPGAREAVSTIRMRSAALRAPSFFMMFAR
jgi:hypothetical protein